MATPEVIIERDALPADLVAERQVAVAYSVLQREDAGDQVPRIEFVARYSDGPGLGRHVMISRIDADDGPATLAGMTGSDLWSPWPSVHPGSAAAATEGFWQVAWSEAGVVVWVTSHGLEEAELRHLVDRIRVRPDRT
ncbi:MAG: hypothetical protein AAF547_02475 [Actinomycetota bacterium]